MEKPSQIPLLREEQIHWLFGADPLALGLLETLDCEL